MNFDTIRNMLADDLRVEPVGLTRMNGRSAMAKYFRYSLVQDRHLVPGFVDRRPAASGARSERYGNVEFDIAGIPPAAEAGTVRRTECRMGYENTEMTNTSMKGNDVNNMYYYALFYDVVDDFVSRRSPYRDDHLRLAREAHRRGALLLAGALSDPVDRALLVFRVPGKTVVEDFARNDPYVINGLVTRWEVRSWTVVIGNEAAGTQPQAV